MGLFNAGYQPTSFNYQLSMVLRDAVGQRRSLMTGQFGFGGQDRTGDIWADCQAMMRAIDKLTDAVIISATLALPLEIDVTTKQTPGPTLADFAASLRFDDHTTSGTPEYKPNTARLLLPAVNLTKFSGGALNLADVDVAAFAALCASNSLNANGYYQLREFSGNLTLLGGELRTIRTTAHNRTR